MGSLTVQTTLRQCYVWSVGRRRHAIQLLNGQAIPTYVQPNIVQKIVNGSDVNYSQPIALGRPMPKRARPDLFH